MGSLSPEQFQRLLEGPALAPPPGIVPDFDAPSDRLVIDHVFLCILIVVTTTCLVLRLYTKLFIARSLARDDWLLLAGWISLMAFATLSEYARQRGGGKHQWNIRLGDMPSVLWSALAASVLYGVATTFIKCSILLQYLSIFNISGEHDMIWWSCWGLVWFLSIFYFAASCIQIFGCYPIRKAWTPWLTEGTCVNTLALSVASSAVNMVADLVMIILPQRSIWALNVPLHKKIKASLVFTVGLFALASSILRTYYAVGTVVSPDFTYGEDIMCLWAYLEFITTIVCACIPSLARLGKHVKPTTDSHIKHSYSSSRSKSSNSDRSASLGLNPFRATSNADLFSEKPFRTLSNDSSLSQDTIAEKKAIEVLA